MATGFSGLKSDFVFLKNSIAAAAAAAEEDASSFFSLCNNGLPAAAAAAAVAASKLIWLLLFSFSCSSSCFLLRFNGVVPVVKEMMSHRMNEWMDGWMRMTRMLFYLYLSFFTWSSVGVVGVGSPAFVLVLFLIFLFLFPLFFDVVVVFLLEWLMTLAALIKSRFFFISFRLILFFGGKPRLKEDEEKKTWLPTNRPMPLLLRWGEPTRK